VCCECAVQKYSCTAVLGHVQKCCWGLLCQELRAVSVALVGRLFSSFISAAALNYVPKGVCGYRAPSLPVLLQLHGGACQAVQPAAVWTE
jgi:hypothetical protein